MSGPGRYGGAKKSASRRVPTVSDLLPYAANSECYLVAEYVAKLYPTLRYDAGYYVYAGDEPGMALRNEPDPRSWAGRAGDHAWCVAPDGTIVDPTYAQIDPSVKVAFIQKGDPRHRRYHSWSEHHSGRGCLLRKLRVEEECQAPGCDYKGRR